MGGGEAFDNPHGSAAKRTFPLNEVAEVGSGSNVSNSAARGVSVAFEVIREGVDVWSTDSTPQAE